MIITSNPPTSLSPKTNKSWGVCGWQKNWIERVNIIFLKKKVD
jgi:hypothetical protein